MTRLVIAARGEFPAALAAVQDWLQPIEHPHYVVHRLHESDLCSSRYPTDALSLLNAVIVDQQWVPRELGQCLDQIVQVAPNLAQDAVTCGSTNIRGGAACESDRRRATLSAGSNKVNTHGQRTAKSCAARASLCNFCLPVICGVTPTNPNPNIP